jgi:amino acid adenylation domain-containing protein
MSKIGPVMPLIQEILFRSSIDFPDKEAVVCGDDRISYGELERASSILANFLLTKGVKRSSRIGIFTNKSINEIIAIFAILKVGGIFIHINPQYKENHLSHVIADCDIEVLFIDDFKSAILKNAFPVKSPIKIVASLSSTVNLDSKVNKRIFFLNDILAKSTLDRISFNQLDDNDVASIIYTSGSTGMPKGVIITHKIFYDSTAASARILENNSEDRLISVTPFSFDGALSQLFTSILVGGTLVQQKSSFPKDVVTTLIEEKITGFHAMPSFWRIMLQKYSPFPKYDYPDLRYVSIIGEVFPEKQLDKLREILKKTKFYMMYGTTEAFRSTYLPPEDFERKKGSVGIPFPGVEISIVDEQGKACRTGEIGEIIHKGSFISPGYRNEKSNNYNIFKKGYIHTGDLGKLDEDGYLYFIGRKDSMLKVQGYRVSPAEIESCLYQIEGIKEAAVIGIPGDETGTGILAVIAAKDGYELSREDIIFRCRGRLPNYMVPNEVQFLDDLPRTATFKINNSELIKMIKSGKPTK